MSQDDGTGPDDAAGPALRKRADAACDAAIDALVRAARLYKQSLGQQTDIYERGKVRKKLWEVERALGHHREYFSQAGQDRALNRTYFKDKQFGVFVEIGGYNGWEGSNCFFFEKLRHWTGLVVEASPSLVREIEKIRIAEVVHAAIADRDGTADFVDITAGYRQMGGLADRLSERHMGVVRKHPDHGERVVQVPTMRLERLLREHEMAEIDYCSIDVEGAERAILADFDFAAFDIRVFSVENNRFNAAGSVRDIMEPAGYRLADVIGADEIYVRRA